MAPTFTEGLLAKRYTYCRDDFGNVYRCDSSWNNWGRWVASGVIVFSLVLLALLFSCYRTRRRRRQGIQPMYGTGWMAPKPPGQPGQQPGYYPNQPYAAAAPPYSPPQHTGNTFNSNDGYYGNNQPGGYGGQQSGIELQQPQSAYQPQRGGAPVYEAPYGAPAKKGDAVIR